MISINDTRREELKKASSLIGDASAIVERVKDEEQDSLDNIPENLQGGNRYQSMENAIDMLSDALDSMSEASEYIERAKY